MKPALRQQRKAHAQRRAAAARKEATKYRHGEGKQNVLISRAKAAKAALRRSGGRS